LNQNREFDELNVAFLGYHSHIRFYADIINKEKERIKFKDYKNLQSKDIVIASHQEILDFIENNFFFEIIETYGVAKVYRINGIREEKNSN